MSHRCVGVHWEIQIFKSPKYRGGISQVPYNSSHPMTSAETHNGSEFSVSVNHQFRVQETQKEFTVSRDMYAFS